MKLGITAGALLVLLSGTFLLYEYLLEGPDAMMGVLTYAPFWMVSAMLFGLFIVVLSKVVILPLKKFELHISELEKDKDKGTFALKKERKDEIGHLVKAFNKLHLATVEKMKKKDSHIEVLQGFINATSGILDIPQLMDEFFRISGAAVDYYIGAYVVSHKNHKDGKIYSNIGEPDKAIVKELSDRLTNELRGESETQDNGDFDLGGIKLTILNARPWGDERVFFCLPLICFGKKAGAVMLITNPAKKSDHRPDYESSSMALTSMVRHASIVTERLLTHMSADEKRLSNILSSISDGVYLIDRAGHAISVNKKGVDLLSSYCMYGRECVTNDFNPSIGNCPHSIEETCEFSKVINRIKNIDPWKMTESMPYTIDIKSQDGRIVQFSVSRLVSEDRAEAGYVVTARDMTDDRRIQKKIMLSSKLVAMGEMAAGVAHEVNNPLQVMLANLELLECKEGDKNQKRVENMKDGIHRIKGIVKDLLMFTREQTTNTEEVDVENVIEKAHSLMHYQLKQANVDILLDLNCGGAAVKGNRNLFLQVLINLLQNAKDAIEEARMGTRVLIRTAISPGPGKELSVVVSDDGPGITERIADRIFDPFFTTKDVGKGTGLGLSISRKIIEGMGGSISVIGRPLKGTKFIITLPQAESKSHEAYVMESPSYDANYSCLADKSVIIVDDEENIGRAVMEGIAPIVARTEYASDGMTAIKRISEKDYDFILLDIKMPGMNGMDTYRRISEHKPYLCQRIIFITGDPVTESSEAFIKLTKCDSISKPFKKEEILSAMCRYGQGGVA